MKRALILSLALVAGVATVLVVGHVGMGQKKVIHARAQWERVYRTPLGLIADADLIVEARHVSAELGRVVGDGEDATPFTNNTFVVDSMLKGEFNEEYLVVEQTGGALPDQTILDIDDGGPYEPGTSYLLFLKNQGEGTYYVINHQARYRIDSALEGVDPTDDVVAQLHGLRLEDLREPVRRVARMLQ